MLTREFYGCWWEDVVTLLSLHCHPSKIMVYGVKDVMCDIQIFDPSRVVTRLQNEQLSARCNNIKCILMRYNCIFITCNEGPSSYTYTQPLAESGSHGDSLTAAISVDLR